MKYIHLWLIGIVLIIGLLFTIIMAITAIITLFTTFLVVKTTNRVLN
jgi:preprotein translocase subunit SecF